MPLSKNILLKNKIWKFFVSIRFFSFWKKKMQKKSNKIKLKQEIYKYIRIKQKIQMITTPSRKFYFKTFSFGFFFLHAYWKYWWVFFFSIILLVFQTKRWKTLWRVWLKFPHCLANWQTKGEIWRKWIIFWDRLSQLLLSSFENYCMSV